VRLEALPRGLRCPCSPPLAVVRPAGWQPPAGAPRLPRRRRSSHRPCHVRPPPRVLGHGRTSPPPRLMHPHAPPPFDHRVAAARPTGCGRAATLVRPPRRDLDGTVPRRHPWPAPRAHARVVAQGREVTHGPCGQPSGPPAPDPGAGQLATVALPGTGHQDTGHALPDQRWARRHGGGGRRPPRGHGLRPRRQRLPRGARPRRGWRLPKARLVRVPVSMGQEGVLPGVGAVAGDHAGRGVAHAVVAGGPCRLRGRPRQARWPPLVQGPPRLRPGRGRLPGEGPRRRVTGRADLLTDAGLDGCPRAIGTRVPAIVGGQPRARGALSGAGPPRAPVHAAATRAADDAAGQPRGARPPRPQRLRTGTGGGSARARPFRRRPGDGGGDPSVQDDRARLARACHPSRPGTARRLWPGLQLPPAIGVGPRLERVFAELWPGQAVGPPPRPRPCGRSGAPPHPHGAGVRPAIAPPGGQGPTRVNLPTDEAPHVVDWCVRLSPLRPVRGGARHARQLSPQEQPAMVHTTGRHQPLNAVAPLGPGARPTAISVDHPPPGLGPAPGHSPAPQPVWQAGRLLRLPHWRPRRWAPVDDGQPRPRRGEDGRGVPRPRLSAVRQTPRCPPPARRRRAAGAPAAGCAATGGVGDASQAAVHLAELAVTEGRGGRTTVARGALARPRPEAGPCPPR
jgi:hypothetical protein